MMAIRQCKGERGRIIYGSESGENI
jgi:hypothetical protein